MSSSNSWVDEASIMMCSYVQARRIGDLLGSLLSRLQIRRAQLAEHPGRRIAADRVNGGLILGQRGGVKAGH